MSNQPSTRRVARAFQAARNTRRLKEALEAYLHSIQIESERLMDDPKWGKGGKYDPVADAGVWTGSRAKSEGGEHAEVVLHFDGAGYDYFYNGSPMSRPYRKAVIAIAKKLGFHMEDNTNWNMAFYPE